MRQVTMLAMLVMPLASEAADLESRALTHYIPQDALEAIVRKEGWTEIVLKPYNGVRKGDIARIWAGGLIDHGGGNQPGANTAGPEGLGDKAAAGDNARMFLSQDAKVAFALLFKTDDGKIHRCVPQGQPLQVPLGKDGARLWVGFNDMKGRYHDNHLGRGRRYELDPLWVRIEVIRIVVD